MRTKVTPLVGDLWHHPQLAFGANGEFSGYQLDASKTYNVLNQIPIRFGWADVSQSDCNDVTNYGFIGVKNDGTMWATGIQGSSSGNNYLLGLSAKSTSVLTQVGTASNWLNVVAGAGTRANGAYGLIQGIPTVARAGDGTLWFSGPCSADSAQFTSSPVLLTSFTQLRANTFSSFQYINQRTFGGIIGISSVDSSIWFWGSFNNTWGGVSNWNSPIQKDSRSWKSLISSDGLNTLLAVKSDGTLYGGGNNSALYSMPLIAAGSTLVQIGADTNWSKVYGVDEAFRPGYLALKTDGTLWYWGAPERMYGVGIHTGVNPTYISSPTQLSGLSNVSLVDSNNKGYLRYAICTNGDLYLIRSSILGTYNMYGTTLPQPLSVGSGSMSSNPVLIGRGFSSFPSGGSYQPNDTYLFHK